MILCLRVERLSERLQGLGGVIDRYERGDPDFAEAAIAWLRATESLMAGLRAREAGELAVLRGGITRSGERALQAEGERVPRGALRRARAVAAAEALERAGALVQQLVGEAEGRLRHFEGKLIEAITAGVLVGLVTARGEVSQERWLALTWRRLAEHQATRPTAVYIASALHAPDRLYILDRVLARLGEPEMTVLGSR